MSLISSQIKTKYLNKVKIQLLNRKKWGYLRYLHLKEGLKVALKNDVNISSFLSVGCGTGLAEVAIALEFPEIQFTITDVGRINSLEKRLGIRMIKEWSISNIKYGIYDVLTPSRDCYDFVASVEVLEHIKNDVLASQIMCQTASKYVFALIPFATEKQNLDPSLKNIVWRDHEHYRVGYNYNSLLNLFPGTIIVRGCYWENFGVKFREKLDNLSNEEIKFSALELMEIAEHDLLDSIPNNYNKCRGIWMLSAV